MNFFIVIILFLSAISIDHILTTPVNSDDPLTRIISSKQCADDIKKLCADIKQNTDIAILTCLQDSEEVMRQISTECQHFLWEYKHKLTKSKFFDKITMEQCSDELKTSKECKDADIGHKAPCLVDYKDKITNEQCARFLDEISVIIFSDYHLIYKFVDKCMPDIKKLKCGRITKPGAKDGSDDDSDKSLKETGVSFADYVTSQSHTLDCLIDAIQQINIDCQHQILRLSELQSNDYHLNRGLYMACREDRENLCPKVKSGEGRVYSCLMKAKSSDKMSTHCREALTRKQQVESLDAQANYPLFHNCKEDIKNNKCFTEVATIRHDVVLMSVVLMCLHDSEIRGNKLQPNCRKEIDERRSEMLEDYKISPEVLNECKTEVESHCKANENEPGEVVYCLMKLAEPYTKNKSGQLSDKCKSAMMTLIKAANPTHDVMSGDVAVRQACSSSFEALCSENVNEKESFQCLVQNLDSPKMAPKCRNKITSLLYFISLDITIDDKLNMACHKDAVRLCNEPNSFEKSKSVSPMEKQLQYHCMYDHFKKDKILMELAEARGVHLPQNNLSLSVECSLSMFTLIKAQASKIEVDPIVFIPCFDDLSKYCGDPENRGKEHECLQRNIKNLEKKCRTAIIEFSQLEDVDSRLNRMLSDACVPMVQQFCANEKPEHMLVCLSEHKFHPQMSEVCHAAIEHMQIMSLEEYHIDHRFASFCGPEIEKYCQNELNQKSPNQEDRNNQEVSKATIVSCLSKTLISKLLSGDKHPLSDVCRRQFTFELLQRSESVKLDPSLLKDCRGDIQQFCRKVESKHINSCLRSNQDNLSEDCHKRLFRRERLEALDADFDGELQQKCGQMIREHCHNVPGRNVFRCLHQALNDIRFDQNCKKLIYLRLERRMNDIRLNPGLIDICRIDIKKHCKVAHPNQDAPDSGIEYEGKIILCLKMQYTNNSQSLQSDCRKRVLEIIIEANTNMKLDPTLRRNCKRDMNELCKTEMSNNFEDTINSVHNCLKHKFLRDELREEKCKNEVARLLKEGKADVHVDGELFDACEHAIMKLCRTESFGNGRKMSCLLSLVEDQKALKMIDSRCVKMIKDRQEMWAKAGNYESQSLVELYDHVVHSSTRVYLLSMLGLIVAALILLGICCGRVTKRVAVDLKNK